MMADDDTMSRKALLKLVVTLLQESILLLTLYGKYCSPMEILDLDSPLPKNYKSVNPF